MNTNEYAPSNVELRPPYVLEYNKLISFFGGDPTIKITPLDDETKSCCIKTDDTAKAEILKNILSTNALTVHVTSESDTASEADVAYLLKDNPLFSRLYSTSGYPKYSAVMLNPVIIPVNTDSLFSPSGYDPYLPQQLAREILRGARTNFQTDLEKLNACPTCSGSTTCTCHAN